MNHHLILCITPTDRPCWTSWWTLLNASARRCCRGSLICMWLSECSLLLLWMLLLLLVLSVIVFILKVLLGVSIIIQIVYFWWVSECIIEILVAISILRRCRMQWSRVVVTTSSWTCNFIHLKVLVKLMMSSNFSIR